MDTTLRFLCPGCGERLRAPASAAGERRHCDCGQGYTVPAPEHRPAWDRVPWGVWVGGAAVVAVAACALVAVLVGTRKPPAPPPDGPPPTEAGPKTPPAVVAATGTRPAEPAPAPAPKPAPPPEPAPDVETRYRSPTGSIRGKATINVYGGIMTITFDGASGQLDDLKFEGVKEVKLRRSDGTLLADKEGVVVREEKGRVWRSRKVRLDGEDVFAFFPDK